MLLGLRHIMDDVFFFKQKTAYEVRISDWRSDVCSSDLIAHYALAGRDDTPFWRDVAAAGIPDSLAERIEAFRATGNILFEPRSEERRVGKECVSTCRSRWSPYH